MKLIALSLLIASTFAATSFNISGRNQTTASSQATANITNSQSVRGFYDQVLQRKFCELIPWKIKHKLGMKMFQCGQYLIASSNVGMDKAINGVLRSKTEFKNAIQNLADKNLYKSAKFKKEELKKVFQKSSATNMGYSLLFSAAILPNINFLYSIF